MQRSNLHFKLGDTPKEKLPYITHKKNSGARRSTQAHDNVIVVRAQMIQNIADQHVRHVTDGA